MRVSAHVGECIRTRGYMALKQEICSKTYLTNCMQFNPKLPVGHNGSPSDMQNGEGEVLGSYPQSGGSLVR